MDIVLRRNMNLVKTGLELHQQGRIRPNTYILDLDVIGENARKLKEEADRNNIELYMMTKQIGRNPAVAKLIGEKGIDKAVAVDPWEALTLARQGIKLGNVGHLVQIPSKMLREIIRYEPEVITVFTVDKAREVSAEALKQDRVQDIILKVIDRKDFVYEGQVGGFAKDELEETVKVLETLEGIRIVGVTTFPCLLYDDKAGQVVTTPNVATLLESARILEGLGLELEQINIPSANSVSSIPMIGELGGTHGEPGHAFTGTMPINAHIDQPEVPGIIYISEISHSYQDQAYAYGGGHYRRGHMENALVGRTLDQALDNILDVTNISPENIDYYGGLQLGEREVNIGDTVIYAFRTQIFVTRSEVALVAGISSGNPRLLGIYDNLGKRVE